MKLFMELLTLIEKMIILDTSVWIALLDPDDTGYIKAKNLCQNINPLQLKMMDSLYSEILTVARNKISDETCNKFCNFLEELNIKISLMDKNTFIEANSFFFKFDKLSFMDCLLLAFSKINNATLLTFDKYLQKTWEELNAHS